MWQLALTYFFRRRHVLDGVGQFIADVVPDQGNQNYGRMIFVLLLTRKDSMTKTFCSKHRIPVKSTYYLGCAMEFSN